MGANDYHSLCLGTACRSVCASAAFERWNFNYSDYGVPGLGRKYDRAYVRTGTLFQGWRKNVE